jgi:polyhydroxyalkanoate synthesis regulator phasin
MSDHRHESYEVYGLESYPADVQEALNLASGLREDLGNATERITDLERRLSALEREVRP